MLQGSSSEWDQVCVLLGQLLVREIISNPNEGLNQSHEVTYPKSLREQFSTAEKKGHPSSEKPVCPQVHWCQSEVLCLTSACSALRQAVPHRAQPSSWTAQISSAALWPVLGNANEQCNCRPFLLQLLGFILDRSLQHLAALKRVIKIVLKTCALTERCSDRPHCYFNWLNFLHSFPFCAARIFALWEFSHSCMFYCSANSQRKLSGAARIFPLSFNPL